MTFSIGNPEGGCNKPLRKICLGKTLRITRVKTCDQNYVYFTFTLPSNYKTLMKQLIRRKEKPFKDTTNERHIPKKENLLACFIIQKRIIYSNL